MTSERPVSFGFRDATDSIASEFEHRRIQVFAGRNPGARAHSGVLVFRADEWPVVREALLAGGFDEMERVSHDPA